MADNPPKYQWDNFPEVSTPAPGIAPHGWSIANRLAAPRYIDTLLDQLLKTARTAIRHSQLPHIQFDLNQPPDLSPQMVQQSYDKVMDDLITRIGISIQQLSKFYYDQRQRQLQLATYARQSQLDSADLSSEFDSVTDEFLRNLQQ